MAKTVEQRLQELEKCVAELICILWASYHNDHTAEETTEKLYERYVKFGAAVRETPTPKVDEPAEAVPA